MNEPGDVVQKRETGLDVQSGEVGLGVVDDEHTNLINFNLDVVEPDPSTGLLKFEDLGVHEGRCYLRCHGENHSPKTYPD